MKIEQKTTATNLPLSASNSEGRLQVNSLNQDFAAALPIAIYTCDLEGRLTFYNDAAARLWGRKPEIGKDMWCGSWKIYRTDGTNLPLDQCPMAKALTERREVENEEIVVERPDGTRLNILPHPKPITDSKGEFIGAINMLIDISSKNEKENKLRKSQNEYKLFSEILQQKVEERTHSLKLSEERYHKMIEEVQDYAILLLDKQGTILNWNKGAEKIKGYSEKEIIGKNFRLFYLQEDRNRNLPEQLIEEATKNGRAMHEGWRLKKNGEKFWGSIVITALHNEEGEVISYSKVTRDLTERKLAEDKMKQYALDIEFRNKQLEEYAHVASHDLQEPLRKIQVFSELLENNIHDEKAATKHLRKIKSSAERMTNLIKDVLKYSQLPKDNDLIITVDLNDILEQVQEDYDLLISERGAKISCKNLPKIEGITIQLHQLFTNLIGNSIKFCDKEPRITITSEKAPAREIEKHPQLSPYSSYHKILFKDNGQGFDPKYAEQIFELFKRLDNDKMGTGIGLPLCKKIVENHDGHITVESEPGKGTTFTIFFPVNRDSGN